MMEMAGARARLEREERERITLAWTVAGLSRAKRLPKLETLLRGRPKKQPPEVLQAMFDALVVKWGAKEGP